MGLDGEEAEGRRSSNNVPRCTSGGSSTNFTTGNSNGTRMSSVAASSEDETNNSNKAQNSNKELDSLVSALGSSKIWKPSMTSNQKNKGDEEASLELFNNNPHKLDVVPKHSVHFVMVKEVGKPQEKFGKSTGSALDSSANELLGKKKLHTSSSAPSLFQNTNLLSIETIPPISPTGTSTFNSVQHSVTRSTSPRTMTRSPKTPPKSSMKYPNSYREESVSKSSVPPKVPDVMVDEIKSNAVSVLGNDSLYARSVDDPLGTDMIDFKRPYPLFDSKHRGTPIMSSSSRGMNGTATFLARRNSESGAQAMGIESWKSYNSKSKRGDQKGGRDEFNNSTRNRSNTTPNTEVDRQGMQLYPSFLPDNYETDLRVRKISLAKQQSRPYSVTEIKGMGLYQHFKGDIMISYSRKYTQFAKKLVNALNANGVDPWIDWNDIPPATDWKEQIEVAIQNAYAVIAIISEPYLESKFCRDEIEIAKENGKLLVPVVYRDVPYNDVWPEIARMNWTFMRESDDFEAGMKKLLLALHCDFDYVQRHAELCRKALEYKKKGSKDLLLRGQALKNAKAFLEEGQTKHPVPISEQIEFIELSKALRRRDKTCRRASFFVITILALAVAASIPTIILLVTNNNCQ